MGMMPPKGPVRPPPPITIRNPDGLIILEPGVEFRTLPRSAYATAAFTSVELGGPEPEPAQEATPPIEPDPYAMPPHQVAPW